MITTEIMAKLQLFHLYVKHWGGEKSLLSGLEDWENIKRGMLWMGYLLWVASLPKHSQEKSAACIRMVMARWGERQGVYARSSNPKPYSNLTFLDKKKLQRRKGGDSITHQQSDKYLKGCNRAVGTLVASTWKELNPGFLAFYWSCHEYLP